MSRAARNRSQMIKECQLNWPPDSLAAYISSEDFRLRTVEIRQFLRHRYKFHECDVFEGGWTLLSDALVSELRGESTPHPLLRFEKFATPAQWWKYVLVSWKRRVIHNRMSRENSLDSEVEDVSDSPLQKLLRSEELREEESLIEELPSILKEFPEDMRRVMEGYRAGISNKEIAKKLGLSPSRISQLFDEGIQKIRGLLGKQRRNRDK